MNSRDSWPEVELLAASEMRGKEKKLIDAINDVFLQKMGEHLERNVVALNGYYDQPRSSPKKSSVSLKDIVALAPINLTQVEFEKKVEQSKHELDAAKWYKERQLDLTQQEFWDKAAANPSLLDQSKKEEFQKLQNQWESVKRFAYRTGQGAKNVIERLSLLEKSVEASFDEFLKLKESDEFREVAAKSPELVADVVKSFEDYYQATSRKIQEEKKSLAYEVYYRLMHMKKTANEQSLNLHGVSFSKDDDYFLPFLQKLENLNILKNLKPKGRRQEASDEMVITYYNYLREYLDQYNDEEMEEKFNSDLFDFTEQKERFENKYASLALQQQDPSLAEYHIDELKNYLFPVGWNLFKSSLWASTVALQNELKQKKDLVSVYLNENPNKELVDLQGDLTNQQNFILENQIAMLNNLAATLEKDIGNFKSAADDETFVNDLTQSLQYLDHQVLKFANDNLYKKFQETKQRLDSAINRINTYQSRELSIELSSEAPVTKRAWLRELKKEQFWLIQDRLNADETKKLRNQWQRQAKFADYTSVDLLYEAYSLADNEKRTLARVNNKSTVRNQFTVQKMELAYALAMRLQLMTKNATFNDDVSADLFHDLQTAGFISAERTIESRHPVALNGQLIVSIYKAINDFNNKEARQVANSAIKKLGLTIETFGTNTIIAPADLAAFVPTGKYRFQTKSQKQRLAFFKDKESDFLKLAQLSKINPTLVSEKNILDQESWQSLTQMQQKINQYRQENKQFKNQKPWYFFRRYKAGIDEKLAKKWDGYLTEQQNRLASKQIALLESWFEIDTDRKPENSMSRLYPYAADANFKTKFADVFSNLLANTANKEQKRRVQALKRISTAHFTELDAHRKEFYNSLKKLSLKWDYEHFQEFKNHYYDLLTEENKKIFIDDQRESLEDLANTITETLDHLLLRELDEASLSDQLKEIDSCLLWFRELGDSELNAQLERKLTQVLNNYLHSLTFYDQFGKSESVISKQYREFINNAVYYFSDEAKQEFKLENINITLPQFFIYKFRKFIDDKPENPVQAQSLTSMDEFAKTIWSPSLFNELDATIDSRNVNLLSFAGEKKWNTMLILQEGVFRQENIFRKDISNIDYLTNLMTGDVKIITDWKNFLTDKQLQLFDHQIDFLKNWIENYTSQLANLKLPQEIPNIDVLSFLKTVKDMMVYLNDADKIKIEQSLAEIATLSLTNYKEAVAQAGDAQFNHVAAAHFEQFVEEFATPQQMTELSSISLQRLSFLSQEAQLQSPVSHKMQLFQQLSLFDKEKEITPQGQQWKILSDLRTMVAHQTQIGSAASSKEWSLYFHKQTDYIVNEQVNLLREWATLPLSDILLNKDSRELLEVFKNMLVRVNSFKENTDKLQDLSDDTVKYYGETLQLAYTQLDLVWQAKVLRQSLDVLSSSNFLTVGSNVELSKEFKQLLNDWKNKTSSKNRDHKDIQALYIDKIKDVLDDFLKNTDNDSINEGAQNYLIKVSHWLHENDGSHLYNQMILNVIREYYSQFADLDFVEQTKRNPIHFEHFENLIFKIAPEYKHKIEAAKNQRIRQLAPENINPINQQQLYKDTLADYKEVVGKLGSGSLPFAKLWQPTIFTELETLLTSNLAADNANLTTSSPWQHLSRMQKSLLELRQQMDGTAGVDKDFLDFIKSEEAQLYTKQLEYFQRWMDDHIHKIDNTKIDELPAIDIMAFTNQLNEYFNSLNNNDIALKQFSTIIADILETYQDKLKNTQSAMNRDLVMIIENILAELVLPEHLPILSSTVVERSKLIDIDEQHDTLKAKMQILALDAHADVAQDINVIIQKIVSALSNDQFIFGKVDFPEADFKELTNHLSDITNKSLKMDYLKQLLPGINKAIDNIFENRGRLINPSRTTEKALSELMACAKLAENLDHKAYNINAQRWLENYYQQISPDKPRIQDAFIRYEELLEKLAPDLSKKIKYAKDHRANTFKKISALGQDYARTFEFQYENIQGILGSIHLTNFAQAMKFVQLWQPSVFKDVSSNLNAPISKDSISQAEFDLWNKIVSVQTLLLSEQNKFKRTFLPSKQNEWHDFLSKATAKLAEKQIDIWQLWLNVSMKELLNSANPPSAHQIENILNTMRSFQEHLVFLHQYLYLSKDKKIADKLHGIVEQATQFEYRCLHELGNEVMTAQHKNETASPTSKALFALMSEFHELTKQLVDKGDGIVDKKLVKADKEIYVNESKKLLTLIEQHLKPHELVNHSIFAHNTKSSFMRDFKNPDDLEKEYVAITKPQVHKAAPTAKST